MGIMLKQNPTIFLLSAFRSLLSAFSIARPRIDGKIISGTTMFSLEGVTVNVKGSNIGVLSDSNGVFSVNTVITCTNIR